MFFFYFFFFLQFIPLTSTEMRKYKLGIEKDRYGLDQKFPFTGVQSDRILEVAKGLWRSSTNPC